MRSAVVVAAFAAGAIAVPYQKRDIVTDVDVVYATEYVTVTAGTASSTSSASHIAHYGHHSSHWWKSQWSSIASASSTEAAPVKASSTSVAPPPPSSTYVAPATSQAPAPTSSAAPPPSTSQAPAPTTYAAPSSSAAPVTSAAPVSTIEQASEPSSYSAIAVMHHNYHRTNHSASDIEWDSALAATAGKIAASCVYAHNTEMDGGGYGQNIAAGVEPANISAVITDLFYNGEVGWYADLYGQAQPSMDNFEHWGHMSQIVWKSTTKVGCATVDCSGQGLGNVGSDVSPYFTVCNYGPPGNYANEYGTNIGSPLGSPTIEWNQGISNAGATS